MPTLAQEKSRTAGTIRLALRELESRLSPINSTSYRAMRIGTFAGFAREWETEVLSTMKPSTESAIKSQLKVNLVPFFGEFAMRDITARAIQSFIHSRKGKAPKTIKNYILTLHMMWRQAKAWNYVTHDPFDGLVLPKDGRTKRFFFIEEEVKRIINAATEPERTLYWLAAETGLRAGELFGLRAQDINLAKSSVTSTKQFGIERSKPRKRTTQIVNLRCRQIWQNT
jgi:integrase